MKHPARSLDAQTSRLWRRAAVLAVRVCRGFLGCIIGGA
jgi:hypothetical protein